MADIDGFDLDRSTAQAWSEFQVRLGEVVSMIDESGDLTIGTATVVDEAAPYVRFSSPRRLVLRCEVPGNGQLDPRHQLSADQETLLVQAGWQPGGPAATPTDGPYVIEDQQDHYEQVAELAVCVLRDVFGVKHPVFLAPDQLAEILQPAPAPLEPPLTTEGVVRDAGAAGSAVRASTALVGAGRAALDRLVDAELTVLYGHPPIRDEEGDVAIRVGSTMIFLRTTGDGREVVIFAALVHDVSGRSRAAEVLNDLNVEARWVKFQLVRDRVFVTMSVQAAPFVAAHLRHALRIVSEVADGIDDDLAVKLHGRTTFQTRDDS